MELKGKAAALLLHFQVERLFHVGCALRQAHVEMNAKLSRGTRAGLSACGIRL
jgi:hypothetical protein